MGANGGKAIGVTGLGVLDDAATVSKDAVELVEDTGDPDALLGCSLDSARLLMKLIDA